MSVINVILSFRSAAITVTLVLCSMAGRGQDLVNLGPSDIGLAVPGLFGEVDFWEQTNGIYGVKVVLGGRTITEASKQPDSHACGIQAWLLQPDGASIPPLDKPATVSSGSFGMVHEATIFIFTRASTNRVEGIVLRYRDKLYCKEIETSG
jgi:hypothetical protein